MGLVKSHKGWLRIIAVILIAIGSLSFVIGSIVLGCILWLSQGDRQVMQEAWRVKTRSTSEIERFWRIHHQLPDRVPINNYELGDRVDHLSASWVWDKQLPGFRFNFTGLGNPRLKNYRMELIFVHDMGDNSVYWVCHSDLPWGVANSEAVNSPACSAFLKRVDAVPTNITRNPVNDETTVLAPQSTQPKAGG